MSMAAKLSDIVDKMSGAILQVDGHVEVLTQGAKDLWEPEEKDSFPSWYMVHVHGTWVGKLAYFSTDPLTIQQGKRAIVSAVLDNRVKAWGPRHPHLNPLAQQPFQFNALRTSPPKDMSGDHSCDYPQSPCRPLRGQESNKRWRD